MVDLADVDLDSVISQLRSRKDFTFTFRVSATRWALLGSEIEKATMLMHLENGYNEKGEKKRLFM